MEAFITKSLRDKYRKIAHGIGGDYTDLSFKIDNDGSDIVDLTPLIDSIYDAGYEVLEIEYYPAKNTAFVVYGAEPPEGTLHKNARMKNQIIDGSESVFRSNENNTMSGIKVPVSEISFAREHGYRLGSVIGSCERGYAPCLDYRFISGVR